MLKHLLLPVFLLALFAMGNAQIPVQQKSFPVYGVKMWTKPNLLLRKGMLWDATDSTVTLMPYRAFKKINDFDKLPLNLALNSYPINMVSELKLHDYDYNRRRSFFLSNSIGLGAGLLVGVLRRSSSQTYDECLAESIRDEYDITYEFFRLVHRCQVKGGKPLLTGGLIGLGTSVIIWSSKHKLSPPLVNYKKAGIKDLDAPTSLELLQYTALKQIAEKKVNAIAFSALKSDVLMDSLAMQFLNYEPKLQDAPIILLDGKITLKSALTDLPMSQFSAITLLNEKEAKATYGGNAGRGIIEVNTMEVGGKLPRYLKVFELKKGQPKLVREIWIE